MSKRMVVIPAPLARVGDWVRVENYRRCNEVVLGKVARVQYDLCSTKKQSGWSYTVFVDALNGTEYPIYVGDRFHPPARLHAAGEAK